MDDVAVKVWNCMGGKLRYEALPILVDMFEVDDAEDLVLRLIVIRDWHNEQDRLDAIS